MTTRQEGSGGGPGTPASVLASPKLRLGLLLGIVAAGTAAFLLVGGPSQDEMEEVVDGRGALAPLLFVSLYAVLTVLLFPGSVLTAAGGAVFGVVAGTALSVAGATAGAIAAFAAGRRLGREQVEQIAGRRLGRIDAWISRRGFLAVLYARLLPVLPFNALNYMAGVTGVRMRDYALATVVGVVPAAFAYAALGSTLDDPASPQFVGAVALVVVLAAGAPVADRALRRRGAQAPPPGDEDGQGAGEGELDER